MTCPPDAFISGEDLIVLKPGDEHTTTFRVSC
jgi:aldose 1-epimerase